MQVMDFAKVDERELFPGYHGRIVHSDRMTFALWDVDPGAAFPEHSHPHEQVVHLLEGDFELTVGGATTRLRPGTLAVVPPGTLHTGRALSRCRILDVFSPAREDYR